VASSELYVGSTERQVRPTRQVVTTLKGVRQGNLDLRLHPNKTAQRTTVNGKPSVWLLVTSRPVAKKDGFAVESELSLRLITSHDRLVH